MHVLEELTFAWQLSLPSLRSGKSSTSLSCWG